MTYSLLIFLSLYYLTSGIDGLEYTYTVWWLAPIFIVILAYLLRLNFSPRVSYRLFICFILIKLIQSPNLHEVGAHINASTNKTLQPIAIHQDILSAYDKMPSTPQKIIEVGEYPKYEDNWTYQALILTYLKRQGKNACALPISPAYQIVYRADEVCERDTRNDIEDKAVLNQLKVEVIDQVRLRPDKTRLLIKLTNQGSVPIIPLHKNNIYHLKLSYTPCETNKKYNEMPWNNRTLVFDAIAPHESILKTLYIENQQRCTLIAFVQELAFWSFDIGVEPTRITRKELS